MTLWGECTDWCTVLVHHGGTLIRGRAIENFRPPGIAGLRNATGAGRGNTLERRGSIRPPLEVGHFRGQGVGSRHGQHDSDTRRKKSIPRGPSSRGFRKERLVRLPDEHRGANGFTTTARHQRIPPLTKVRGHNAVRFRGRHERHRQIDGDILKPDSPSCWRKRGGGSGLIAGGTVTKSWIPAMGVPAAKP
jgi:hypothetical protein